MLTKLKMKRYPHSPAGVMVEELGHGHVKVSLDIKVAIDDQVEAQIWDQVPAEIEERLCMQVYRVQDQIRAQVQWEIFLPIREAL